MPATCISWSFAYVQGNTEGRSVAGQGALGPQPEDCQAPSDQDAPFLGGSPQAVLQGAALVYPAHILQFFCVCCFFPAASGTNEPIHTNLLFTTQPGDRQLVLHITLLPYCGMHDATVDNFICNPSRVTHACVVLSVALCEV